MPAALPAYDLKTSTDNELERAALNAERQGDKKNFLKNVVLGGIAVTGMIFVGAAVTVIGGAAGMITMFGTCVSLATGFLAARPFLEKLDAGYYAEYNRIHDALDARKAARFIAAREQAQKPATPDTTPAVAEDFSLASRRRIGAMKPVRFRPLGFAIFS